MPSSKIHKHRLALSCRRRIGGSCHINTIVLLVIKAASICRELWLWLAPVEKDVHQSECCSRQRSVGSVAWSRGGHTSILLATRVMKGITMLDVAQQLGNIPHCSSLLVRLRVFDAFQYEQEEYRYVLVILNLIYTYKWRWSSVCWCCVFGGHFRITCWTLNRSFA